jgi:hypothetical protein
MGTMEFVVVTSTGALLVGRPTILVSLLPARLAVGQGSVPTSGTGRHGTTVTAIQA